MSIKKTHTPWGTWRDNIKDRPEGVVISGYHDLKIGMNNPVTDNVTSNATYITLGDPSRTLTLEETIEARDALTRIIDALEDQSAQRRREAIRDFENLPVGTVLRSKQYPKYTYVKVGTDKWYGNLYDGTSPDNAFYGTKVLPLDQYEVIS